MTAQEKSYLCALPVLGAGGRYPTGDVGLSAILSRLASTCVTSYLGQTAKALLLIISFGSAKKWSSGFCYELPQN